MRIIMLLSAVFDYIAGAVGELAVLIFDSISGALIEACTLKDSFSDTYSTLLFDSTKGLFRATAGNTNIFGTTDPTAVMTSAALGLVFGLMVWQLFKSLFGNLIQSEEPVKIIWKGLFLTLIISTYKVWTNAILSLVFSPLYTNFANSSVSGQEFLSLKGSIEGDGITGIMQGALAPVFISLSLLKAIVMLILIFPIGIKFIQLSLEVIERFLQMFFIVVFGPMCLACGVSPALSEPPRKWFSVWINGMIGLILNVLGIKLSILAFQNFVNNFSLGNYTTIGEMFVSYIAVYAIFKISCEMDNIQSKLGFDTLHAGGMGLELIGGLNRGVHTVSNAGGALFGNGRTPNMFQRDGAMAAAAAGGSKAAAAAMFLGNKGLVGKAVASGIAVGSSDGRAALGAAMLSRGFRSSSQASGSQFAKELALRSDMGQRGNVDGKDLKKVQQMLNDQGIDGTLTKASFDDKGNLNCQMMGADGNSFNVSMKHGADFSNQKLPDGKSAMSIGEWGAVVPTPFADAQEKQLAQAGSTSAETAEAVASNVVSQGAQTENNVSQNDASAPISGTSAYAAYNTGSGKEGYEQLAVNSSGSLISCNSKGEVVPGGDHVLSATGQAIPKSSLVSSGGNVSTFSNVGSSLLYNKTDGTIGSMTQAQASSGNMPADFASFSRDMSTGLVRTASAAAIISTGMSPTQVSIPTAGTSIAPDKVTTASGGSMNIANDGYRYNVSMGSRNQVTSAGNQVIEAAPSASNSAMAESYTAVDGSCVVQAQRYADNNCSVLSSSGSYIKVGGQGMRISDCAEVNSQGQFSVASSSPSVSKSVQLYNSSGSVMTSMPMQGEAVYAKGSDGVLHQIDSGCVESRVTPSSSGTVSCISGGATTDIKPAPISMRSDGTCKTYSMNSDGQYTENVAGGYIMGSDGGYYEVNSSSVTPVASGTATKYMVGKFETDSSGNIELASASGSESSSFGGVADVKTVHGQTITAFSSRANLQNTQTSGQYCNTISAANADGQSYSLRLTDDNAGTYWQNSDVNRRILETAISTSGIKGYDGNVIKPNIKAMEIMTGDGHLSCINESTSTDDRGRVVSKSQKIHFFDKSMYDMKPGAIPSGKIPQVTMNGSDYYIVDEQNMKLFQRLDNIINRNFNNMN